MRHRPALVALSLSLAACGPAQITAPAAAPAAPPDLSPPLPTYQQLQLDTARFHVVTVADPQAFPVGVAVTEATTPLANFREVQDSLAALNAGFFDPRNGKTTSFATVSGTPVADPRQNPRLMENPDLAPYLEAILNRAEFRHYRCDGLHRYAIVPHSTPVPAPCELLDAVGAGPQLLPADTSVAEGFLAYGAEGTVIRDALGSRSPNARSAVGIRPDGAILLVMAAAAGPDLPGVTLGQLTTVLADLGAEQALNLDGGSSSSLMFDGEVYSGRFDPEGDPITRPIKSALWVAAPSQPLP